VKLPPPPPRAYWDTECYPNYWLLKFRLKGRETYSFSIRNGERFAPEVLERMLQLFELYTSVSFNGIYYDVPMLRAVFQGYTTDQLKWLNDQLIVEKVKPWDLGLGEWSPRDHVDIMAVCPGSGSQNIFAGRIHHHTLEELPIEVGKVLTDAEMELIATKCENDLGKLEALDDALKPQLRQREKLGARYGLDLRSKSDAQVAEAVLKKRCEMATGLKIYKPRIDWGLRFKYKAPEFLQFTLPQLQRAMSLVLESTFTIQPPASMRDDGEAGRCIGMPLQLEGLEIVIGSSTYRMGVGGLHSSEKRLVAVSSPTHQVRMPDVASYYPNLMVNAGAWPSSLGPQFVVEYESIKDERLKDKAAVKRLKGEGQTHTDAYDDAVAGDGGGKIMINGTFGKTGSPYSVMFAPEMLIQTTITGQLSLLMLIEWHEIYGIPVISANTDGIVINCPRDKLAVSEYLIKEWERRTGLEMETDDYVAIYARDVNNYFAIKTPDDVKRKGEYAKAGLLEKKNPDVEICADAVADFLAKGVPIEYTIRMCRDIRKFVTIRKVDGGGVKLWGHCPQKGTLVRDMISVIEAHGWVKAGRKWSKAGLELTAQAAYNSCFPEPVREELGKTVRWYYSTQAPGPIVYARNGNNVGGSYGARPCMVLPSTLPDDIDHAWYVRTAEQMLVDIGFYVLHN
jgi:hypothetical protein